MSDSRVEAYPLKAYEPATVETCAGLSIGGYIADIISANNLNLEDYDILVSGSHGGRTEAPQNKSG